MKSFETFAPEMKSYQDRVTGVTVRQLTSYRCDSYHRYFTNNGFWDSGKRLLFISDRHNVPNLYSIHLESGEIDRMTDFKPGDDASFNFGNDVSSARPEICYVRDNKVYIADLLTLEQRMVYEAPAGYRFSPVKNGGLYSADGNYCYYILYQDISVLGYNGANYIGFEETFRAKPHCQILKIDAVNGGAEVIWEEKCYLGHVNPSPTHSNFLTFCHEGPWNLVDHRMWFLDIDTGRCEKLRPRRVEGEQLGHEYWYADGERIGYQIHRPGEGSFNGVIRYDGTDEKEAPCVKYPGPDHIHSVDYDLIVSDSGSTIKLYQFDGEQFGEARLLCMHDGSFFHQYHHPHPRLTADRKVLYNSNVSRYCQIYLADIPDDVSALPIVKREV